VWCFVAYQNLTPPFLAELQVETAKLAWLVVGRRKFSVPRDAVSTVPYTQEDLDRYTVTKNAAKRSPNGGQLVPQIESPELKKYKKAVSGFFK
jgi:hypothetical protein